MEDTSRTGGSQTPEPPHGLTGFDLKNDYGWTALLEKLNEIVGTINYLTVRMDMLSERIEYLRTSGNIPEDTPNGDV